jgi:hypothetical protein
MLCVTKRRAFSETEIKNTTRKEWDSWYDKQCKGNETEVKTILKDYEKGNDEDRWRKYNTFEKEYVYVKILYEWKGIARNKIGTGEFLDWREIWKKNLQYKR